MNNYGTPQILFKLASALGTKVVDQRLDIPQKYGSGHCIGYVFNQHIRLLISDYELKMEFLLDNPEVDALKKMLFFKFQNVIPKIHVPEKEPRLTELPSVLIATSRINTDEVIAIHTNRATINIEVDAEYLIGHFAFNKTTPVLQSLLENSRPLVFEQIIYPKVQGVIDEMLTESIDEPFKSFFLKVKSEELVCRLLVELEKRDEKTVYALNRQDIETIYKVRELIIGRLQIPPVIKELSFIAGMSPTKLKRIFKQVFGNSIFKYYQYFRMKEASRLLTEEKISVTSVGHDLGFTNLSHFSKVFEEHTGMKPKQFSKSGGTRLVP
ncbi:AraC-like DNA-binding protein [Pedobacter sp. W3I1]|uniref:helix-turn-helix domain-containing protein n=1 Tax=Pedobacter sp. W3I1 TaxID=3042291 RepID=UPI0027846376|nr:AraC family transcriptional regulator [Pedobacter sp. W3I1]MDQ0640267.1 AraC-like DNA-binding protein [Pedobacter sp. W3I1]